MNTTKAAFYARSGTFWSDMVTILHPPYTAWNMSYVALGAALAPDLQWFRLVLALSAFFAGTGILSHALDELNGRPLRTGLTDRELKIVSALGMGAALVPVGIGAIVISPWILAFATIGILLVFAYSLEWFNGLVHNDLGFALSWGGFPVIVGYWSQTETLSWPMWCVAGAATLLSLAQRNLSTPARFVRRKAFSGLASFQTKSGEVHWDSTRLLSTWERPLKLLSWTVVLLTVGFLVTRIS
ncbi:MAG: hypothetical protein ACLFTB_09670 [Desulfovibrionales bacterium]